MLNCPTFSWHGPEQRKRAGAPAFDSAGTKRLIPLLFPSSESDVR